MIKTTLAAAVIAASLGLSACGGSEERQAKYLERAQTMFDEANYEKAKIEVKNVLQINPNNAEARYLLAELEEKDKNWRAMFGQLNAAIEADPNHSGAHIKLAQLFLATNETEQARTHIDQVLAREPDNANALATNAAFYQRQGDTETAIEQAQLALKQDPSNVAAIGVLTAIYGEKDPELALTIIGDGLERQSQSAILKLLKIRVLDRQGKVDDAVGVYRELVRDNPDNLLYTYQLVNYYITHQRNDEAEQLLRTTIDSNPDKPEVKLWLVEFLTKNRTPEEGQKALEAYVEADPDNYALRQGLANFYNATQQSEKTEALYQYVIDTERNTANAIDARNKLVGLALARNDRPRAEALLADIFKLEPENADALLTRGRLKLVDGDAEGAIADLRGVLKSEPDSVPALLTLAAAQERTGATSLALDNYRQALTIDGDNVAALVGAGRLSLSRNDLEQAERLLTEANRLANGNPEIVRLLVDLYARQERYQQAQDLADTLILSQNTQAVGYYLKGRTYLRQQELDKAISALTRSIEEEPRGIESLTALTNAYIANKQADKALAFVQAHVKAYPEQAHGREILGQLQAQNGDLDAARATFEALLDSYPERISTYRQLGRVYLARQDLAGMEALYQRGVDANPDNIEMLMLMAELKQALGKQDQALALYEKLLTMAPTSDVVRNNLANLLMDHFESDANLRRAQELSADLANSDNPAYLDTVGWLQYKLGNYPQALVLLQDAVKKGGTGPVFHYHLGMAYYRSDLPEKAKEHLQQAVAEERARYVGKEEAEATLGKL
jgi:tetratricopeptide (TPR) repeat protein